MLIGRPVAVIGAALLALSLCFAPPALSQASDGRRLETVEVAGVGKNVAEARDDGLRQAVQQLVGVYIDNRRRIEIKMTDKQLQQKVEEHILSYTNAYVDKVEVLGVGDKGGFVEIRLRVTVVVRKLLERLEATDIPTVRFDTKSADAALSSALRERDGAYRIYSSLISDFHKLIRFEIKNSKIDLETPAMPGRVWIRIDADTVLDAEQVRRWKEGFKTIATTEFRARSEFVTLPSYLTGASTTCFRGLDRVSFAPKGREGMQALCHVSGYESGGANLTCRGRAFPERNYLARGERLGAVMSSHVIKADFLNRDGEAVTSVHVDFLHSGWGVMILPLSTSNPSRPGLPGSDQSMFAWSCARDPIPVGGNYSDALVLPDSELRIPGYFMFQIGEDNVRKIAQIRLRVAPK